MQGGEASQVSQSMWCARRIVVLIEDPSNLCVSRPDDPGGIFQPWLMASSPAKESICVDLSFSLPCCRKRVWLSLYFFFPWRKKELFASRAVSPATFTSTKIGEISFHRHKALGKNLSLDSPQHLTQTSRGLPC